MTGIRGEGPGKRGEAILIRAGSKVGAAWIRRRVPFGRDVLIVMHGVLAWPYTLVSLQCRAGALRVFTDQADIACTKREAP